MSEERPGDLPHIPELAKDYQLVRELGRGGTAVVYLARDRELGRDVAIKLIRPAYVRDEDAIARLLREARTIGKLQHPSIVMLLGTRRLGENGLALILQYMPGQTLKDRIQAKGPLPPLDAERILRDLGSALQYAHAQRIVHRDIKPENIYLDEALSLARLADFGIARAWDSDSGLTMPGTAIGTPAYMSPEQVDGKELDGRSDLYSLGLVGYEILTGRQPWAGEGLYNVIYKQKHEELPSISGLRPDVPANLIEAINKAIRKKPADRWNNAGEFLEALAEGSTLPPLASPAKGEVEEAQDWEARLEAMETAVTQLGAEVGTVDAGDRGPAPEDPDQWEPAVGSEPKKRRRVLLGAGVVTVAFVGAGLLAIGTGGGPGGVAGEGAFEGVGTTEDRVGLPGTASDGDLARIPLGPEQATPDQVASMIGIPASLEVLDGDRQVAPSGTTLPVPLVVRVTDREGLGVARVPIVFEVISGGGTSAPESDLSGVDGTVSARWTLGGEEEEGQMLVAWAEGLEDEGAVFLSFVEGVGLALPVPAQAEIVSGATQQGTVGEEVTETLALRVLDDTGSPVPGVGVRFVIESGEGQVSPVSATTAIDGTARSTWQLGLALGIQSVSAEVDGAPGVGVRFEATARSAGLAPVPSVVTGGTHSCSLGFDGSVVCWGGNAGGQLGDGSSVGRLVPSQLVLGGTFARVVSGLGHVCALSLDGEAFCWGSNGQGQLGTGSRESASQPTPVSGSGRFIALSAGVGHTCGIERGGAVLCWGANDSGQLGDGSRDQRNVPTRVNGNAAYTRIAAGWQHTCGLDGQGRAFCWGANASEQLGTSADGSSPTPVPVGGGYRFRAMAAGNAHTCGLADDDRILCWGANDSGQLGDGTNAGRSAPQPVATTARFASVAAGGVHTCGLTVDGGAMCWGTNVYGQLGDGTSQARSAPVPVSGFDRFSQIEAFGSHNCGRTPSGNVLCWGYNVEGQIGDGSRENKSVPTPVASARP